MKKMIYPVIFAALVFAGCAAGKPLLMSDLDEVGWENTTAFQCYLSSGVKLEKLSDDSATQVSFNKEGAAQVQVRDSRWSIDLPTSLEGRILKYHKRDQFLYVAFEDGEATLPFAKDKDGRFSLMVTLDDTGAKFVEYEGVKYKAVYTGLAAPHLNVIINRSRSQSDLRRQMQGSQVRAASNTEEAARLASEQLIDKLPEKLRIVLMGVSSDDTETAVFITDELQHRLVEANKFTVVERKALDALYAEKNFQQSGNVDDESMVSMGKLLGANVVIIGEISGSGSTRRLNLKALDVQSGELLVSVREPL
jgi:PBP1b-binding outer membrane lipoprotein LpoB